MPKLDTESAMISPADTLDRGKFMGTRLTWLIGAAVALSIAAAPSLPVQYPHERPPRQDSFSSGGGPVTESILASWQAHGADDGPIAPMPSVPVVIPGKWSSGGGPNLEAPPGVTRPPGLDQDWMLDLLVLWRWRGRAPEITHSGGGDAGPGGLFVHQIVVTGGRELRVVFDRRAGSAAVQNAAPLTLGGANVLMLDVDEETVRVEAVATVEPRYARLTDPFEAAIARSAEVAAFVGAR